jgi:hypothetical protein
VHVADLQLTYPSGCYFHLPQTLGVVLILAFLNVICVTTSS